MRTDEFGQPLTVDDDAWEDAAEDEAPETGDVLEFRGNGGDGQVTGGPVASVPAKDADVMLGGVVEKVGPIPVPLLGAAVAGGAVYMFTRGKHRLAWAAGAAVAGYLVAPRVAQLVQQLRARFAGQ